MVVIIYGTSAELIKLLGIITKAPRNEIYLICTAQQREQLDQFHKQSNIYPDLYLAQGWRGHDVLNMLQMLGFMIKIHVNFIVNYHKIRRLVKKSNKLYGTKSTALVHGDTLTTVVGAYFGLLLGLRVSHVEAGLRSGRIFHPFPEEIDRLLVTKLTRIHFAPNKDAISNLKNANAKGYIINTKYNTSKDAIEIASSMKSELVQSLSLPKNYGLISIHRTELLERKKELEEFLRIISKHLSSKNKMVFLDHSTTKEKLRVLHFDHYLKNENLMRIPKLAYFDFIQVAKGAKYILTDSGGLQEDAYFLGVPTLIHRMATERSEGLGLNVELSYLSSEKLEEFINQNTHNKTQPVVLRDSLSPSKIVVKWLKQHNYLK